MFLRRFFWKKSKLFYAADGVRRMSEMTVADYLAHAQKRLSEEDERVMTYLDSSTRLPLVRLLENAPFEEARREPIR